MITQRSSFLMFTSGLLAAALLGGQARAADERSGITVTGTGEARAKPNMLEIDLAATGSAELTGDALLKYRDSVKRTIEAFEQLGNKSLKIESRGLGIQTMDANAPNRFNGNPQQGPSKMQIDISGELKLTLSGADKLSEDELTDIISKLVDTAKDSGASVGGNNSAAMMRARMYGENLSASVVTFVLDDIDSHRETARKRAFKQAEARAKQLAALSGAELGPVLSVEETLEGQPASERQRFLQSIGWSDDEGADAKTEGRVSSDKLGEIPIRVSLRVRFALKEK